jgi:hypothetical protein
LARCSHDGQAPKVAPFASASLDINKDSKRLKVLWFQPARTSDIFSVQSRSCQVYI